MQPHPNLSGSTRLSWVQFRRSFCGQYTVTRATDINSPRTASFVSSTPREITFDYGDPLGLSYLSHTDPAVYYRLADGSLLACAPGHAGRPSAWVKYTPINKGPSCEPSAPTTTVDGGAR